MDVQKEQTKPDRAAEGAEMLIESTMGRSSVVRCAQPLDAQMGARLQVLVAGSVQRARRVILDLSAAAYADSAGLRALLALQQRLQTQGTELRLVVRPGSPIDRALRLVGFASLLALYPTVQLAWRAIRLSTPPAGTPRRG